MVDTWSKAVREVALIAFLLLVGGAVGLGIGLEWEEQRKLTLQERVACYADLMQLNHRWDISVVVEPSDDDSYASVIAEPEYWRATIYFDSLRFSEGETSSMSCFTFSNGGSES
jgi:hypothetical protein